MLGAFRTQSRLLLRRPIRKAAAAAEPEMALRNQAVEIWRRFRGPVERWKNVGMDRTRQLRTDEVGVFQGPQDREPGPEARLDHVIDSLRIADAFCDKRNSFAP